MRDMHSSIKASLLVCIVFIVCSCSQPEITNEGTPLEIIQLEGERTMKLITAEEIMQFISENNIDVSADDFDEINIDDFIAAFMFSSPSERDDKRLYDLNDYLIRYKRKIQGGSYTQLQPLILKSADSTDQEYVMFINAYFETLGMEYKEMKPEKEGIDWFIVYTDDGRYDLYIGKTKDIQRYDIRTSDDDEGPLLLYVSGPEPFTSWNMPIYYNKDNKFILGIGGGGSISKGAILRTFTETAAPLPQDE